MASHNVNYQIIPITGGTYTTGQLGDGLSASTVHEIYCLTPGSITITAVGGGTASFPLTAGQSVKILVASCTIISGTYVAFKAKFAYGAMNPIQWGNNS